jgi:hypothetical protein
VTDPIEIQRRLFDLSSGLAEKIGRDIGSHSSALLSVTGSGPKEILHRRGSGSLVSIGDFEYILTANHVWKSFEKAAGLGLDLELPITFPGIPREFTGVSGGGFWDVLIYGTDSGEINWSLRLMGLACWQLDIINGMRGVRCLGAKSIRRLVRELEREMGRAM